MQKENRKSQSRTIEKSEIAKRNEITQTNENRKDYQRITIAEREAKYNRRTKIANEREFKKRERKKASYNRETNGQGKISKPARRFNKNEVTSSYKANYNRETKKKGNNNPNSSDYVGTNYSKSCEQERKSTVSRQEASYDERKLTRRRKRDRSKEIEIL